MTDPYERPYRLSDILGHAEEDEGDEELEPIRRRPLSEPQTLRELCLEEITSALTETLGKTAPDAAEVALDTLLATLGNRSAEWAESGAEKSAFKPYDYVMEGLISALQEGASITAGGRSKTHYYALTTCQHGYEGPQEHKHAQSLAPGGCWGGTRSEVTIAAEKGYCINPNHADGTTTTDPEQCDYARWKGYDPGDEDNACVIVRAIIATTALPEASG